MKPELEITRASQLPTDWEGTLESITTYLDPGNGLVGVSHPQTHPWRRALADLLRDLKRVLLTVQAADAGDVTEQEWVESVRALLLGVTGDMPDEAPADPDVSTLTLEELLKINRDLLMHLSKFTDTLTMHGNLLDVFGQRIRHLENQRQPRGGADVWDDPRYQGDDPPDTHGTLG